MPSHDLAPVEDIAANEVGRHPSVIGFCADEEMKVNA